MDANHIETLVLEFMRDELLDVDAEAVSLDENLLTSGVIDSVGVVRLIAHMSAQLGVEVPPTELVPDNFRTVRVMASYLHRLSEARVRSAG